MQENTNSNTTKNSMQNTNVYPIFEKEIEQFLNSNPDIKNALDLFKISEEQYLKALRSVEPQATTCNKIVIEIEA